MSEGGDTGFVRAKIKPVTAVGPKWACDVGFWAPRLLCAPKERVCGVCLRRRTGGV